VRRACSPRRQRVYVVMDNLNTHRHSILRAFCRTQRITVVPYPAYASWLHLIETHLDAMKRGMLNGSDDPSHVGRRWRTGDLRPRAESRAGHRSCGTEHSRGQGEGSAAFSVGQA